MYICLFVYMYGICVCECVCACVRVCVQRNLTLQILKSQLPKNLSIRIDGNTDFREFVQDEDFDGAAEERENAVCVCVCSVV
jgi:hypothetical protein